VGFFKKKTSANHDSGRAPLVVAVDEQGEKAIAFGVSWRAVASRSSGRADAIKVARAGGATHLISTLQQYGYGMVPSDAAGSARIYAAARVAARQHGGDAIYALKVFEGEYWFAVVRGGQPSSIDRVIFSGNDLELIDAVRQEVENGIEDSVAYAIYTNLEDHELGDRVRRLTPADLMLAAAGDEDVLLPLPKKRAQLPTPVLVVLAVALVAGFGSKGLSYYKEKERQRLARLSRNAEEPPEQAWARATKAWADGHRAPDSQGLAAARVSLGAVPLVWGGWDLQGATCNAAVQAAPVAGAAPKAVVGAPVLSATQGDRRWTCIATYSRRQTGRLNREMKEDVPAGWTVQYRGLETIIASWSVTQAAQPFSFESLRSVEYHLVETVSRLQKLQPSFGQVGEINFAPVEITPPRKSDGMAVPMVPSVPQLRAATFTLKAPLRSIDALIDGGVEAEWQQISVNYRQGDGDKASLKASALTADVKGVIYANAKR